MSAVPIWPHFVTHVLRVLGTRDSLRRRELVNEVMESAKLTADARAETLPSGQNRAAHRIGWVLAHLYKADWIERRHRGVYRITSVGCDWLREIPGADLDYSDAHTLFREYWPSLDVPESRSGDAVVDAAEAIETSPTEQIEAGIGRLENDVADELLLRLRRSPPMFFEDAVVRLLLAMGYGGAEQRGQRIGGTGDGGVDGVIDQDALGMDRIYVQAKRYGEGNPVDREAIQAFIGALHGLGAGRGMFLTTSTFTKDARGLCEPGPDAGGSDRRNTAGDADDRLPGGCAGYAVVPRRRAG